MSGRPDKFPTHTIPAGLWSWDLGKSLSVLLHMPVGANGTVILSYCVVMIGNKGMLKLNTLSNT